MSGVLFKRFLADRQGAAMVFGALMMPVFLGGLGLGGEAGYWYFNQRKVQNAADVAAYAGASRLKSGKSDDVIAEAALAAALETNFKSSIGTITTNTPPTSGAFAGDADAVEVIIQENVPRMISSFFATGDVPMSGRAVARLEQGAVACLLALDPTASGAVTFTGSANAVLDGCNVHANSTAPDAVDVTGSGQVETPCASSLGGVSATAGLNMTHCNSAIEHASYIKDPFKDLAEPSLTGPCEPDNVFGGPPSATYTITGGRYCGGLKIQRTVNMLPGVYIIDGGDFDITSTASVNGAGVTFFLTNGGRLQFNGSAEVQVSAPTSGTYAGVLVYVDRDDPFNKHILNGDSDSWFNGAIYAPTGQINVSGGSSVGGGCTQIVGLRVHVTGDAGLGTDCVGTGVDQIETDQLVTLVE